jgi:guanylate kinase
MIKPLIISGPSGVGKTYLEKYLIANHNFMRIQSTLTRPKREGEIQGIDYNFVTEELYKQMEEEDKFITSAFALGCWRGFEKRLVEEIIAKGKIPVTVVVPSVVPQFMKAYSNTIAVYLKPANDELLISRMKKRGDPEHLINERINHEVEENQYFESIKQYYKEVIMVTKGNFDSLVNRILKLIND